MRSPLPDTDIPTVRLRLPPASLFAFPSTSEPSTLPPPTISALTFRQPFNIPPGIYAELLTVKYPAAIALVYATTVYFLNRLNRRRGHKPWPVSRTQAFFGLVIAHNVLLAAYSGWTFAGMLAAIGHTWPGWDRVLDRADGPAALADAFCQMQGPRGLGQAVTWRPLEGAWRSGAHAVKLLGNAPDATDVGRIWNEGLAFFGWLFYLSKFYEVVDTLIILAKGKRSTFLQTYHHAGAMFGMWAGIRYMSPPIWMFVTFNSGIHMLMYSYYTLSALSIAIPPPAKRALTTLQIAQFVVGATYALLHLFIAYRAPVDVAYVTDRLREAVPSLTSAATSAATALSTAAAAAGSSPGAGEWARKLALRAAGVDRLALDHPPARETPYVPPLPTPGHRAPTPADLTWRPRPAEVACVDTAGQAFAIGLNVMYLAPLTGLFVRFFIKSYLKRARVEGKVGPSGAVPWNPDAVGKSGFEAARGVEKEVLRALRSDRGSARASAYNSATSSEVDEGSKGSGNSNENGNGIGNGIGSGIGNGLKKALKMTSMEGKKDESKGDESKKAEAGASEGKKNEAKDEAKKDEAKSDKGEKVEKEEKGPQPDDKEKNQPGDNISKPEESKKEPKDEGKEEAKEGDDDDDGKSFAKYAAEKGKGGDGDAEAYEANVEEVMSGQEKKAQAQLHPEGSTVLVEKEDGDEPKE